ncbi:hypothetical protein LDENG_00248330 [Lucifuga dentata]|nr:hypothetical protein LDENG_00248330 [Lucifuga dentata]
MHSIVQPGVHLADSVTSRLCTPVNLVFMSVFILLPALKDPCSEVTCSYGSTCVQSSDGLSAKCMCPLGCEGKAQQTVCGSDGKDYRSECELHQQACKHQKNIRVQYHGPCDPCKDNENSLNVMCRVEALTRQPLVFAPPESCPPSNEPLCASDGQTYASECAMTRTGMQKGVKLRKIHAGRCRKLGKATSFLASCR